MSQILSYLVGVIVYIFKSSGLIFVLIDIWLSLEYNYTAPIW